VGIDNGIILKWNLKGIGCEDVDWIHLVQDRDQWRDSLNTVKNIRVDSEGF
jgi:hypothetical protein